MRSDRSRRSFLAVVSSAILVSSSSDAQDRRPKKRVGVVGDIRYVVLPEDLERRAREAMPLKIGGEYSGESLNTAIYVMKDVDSRLLVSPVESSTVSGKWVVVVQVSLKPKE